MTVTTNEYGVVKIEADEGKAICRAGESGPTTVTTLYLAKTESAANYKDCAYGEPIPPRIFVTADIIEVLMEEGYWEAARAWIVEQGLLDLVLATKEFDETNANFVAGRAALQQALGLTDAQIEELLARAAE